MDVDVDVAVAVAVAALAEVVDVASTYRRGLW